MRTVLIHYHIFKNAGSSLDLLLTESFGEGHVLFDPGDPDAVHGPREAMTCIRNNDGARAISSHTLRLPAPAMNGVMVQPLLFLRHPILRAASVYKYDRSLDGSTERQRIARESDFSDYVRWCLQADIVPIFQNFQTLYLSGEQLRYEDPTKARAGREQFVQAVCALEQLEVFGIVERFSESVELFRRRLAHAVPQIEWRHVRENTTGDELGTIDEIRSALGDFVYEQLERANGYDLALYDRAQNLFEASLGSI